MKKEFYFPKEKKYFLVPEMPTPNGRMHLGHIAGPYLKMDIIKRKVHRANGEAYLFSGSDVYESYVELKAFQLNLSTEEVSTHFHKLIIKDFKALNIDFDVFINPLDDKWYTSFNEFHEELMQSLINSNSTVERDELFMYDVENKRFLNGCWLKGICPNCKKKTGSYLCENCGTHYRPQDIFSFDNYPSAKEIKGKALYLKLNPELLLHHVDKMQLVAFKKILERYIELQGPYVRLTTGQQIGVRWKSKTVLGQVLYTYSALLFFSIFCGKMYQERYNLERNPFHTDSDFITIASFGIDNAIPYLAAVLGGGLSLPHYKPFDYYLSNFFYDLNGEKFSTSRLHVIWGGDIVELSQIQSDAVRYYLCKENPEFEKKNFDIYNFIHTINNELVIKFNNSIRNALDSIELNKNYELHDSFFTEIKNTILKQNESVEPPNFRFSEFVNPINDWILRFDNFDEDSKNANAYWWLKTLVYLTYPLMPEFSLKMWNKLYQGHSISNDTFFKNDSLYSKNVDDILFKMINLDNLKLSLPKTIKL